jgi:hypothetical protein
MTDWSLAMSFMSPSVKFGCFPFMSIWLCYVTFLCTSYYSLEGLLLRLNRVSIAHTSL